MQQPHSELHRRRIATFQTQLVVLNLCLAGLRAHVLAGAVGGYRQIKTLPGIMSRVILKEFQSHCECEAASLARFICHAPQAHRIPVREILTCFCWFHRLWEARGPLHLRVRPPEPVFKGRTNNRSLRTFSIYNPSFMPLLPCETAC